MTQTIIVADASPLVRAGVHSALVAGGSYRVVHAADAAEAARAADENDAAVVLADLRLPPSGGVTIAAALARRNGARVCVWSDEVDADDVLAAIAAGSAAFLDKRCAPEELVGALERVAAGEAVLAPRMQSVLFAAIRDGRLARPARMDRLSLREWEVLELISRGLRNREIGDALGISEFTVKRHVQKILGKLELASRREAAAAYRGERGRTDGEVAA